MHTIEKIKRYLNNTPDDIVTIYIDVTKEVAEFLLTFNTNNRPMTERRVLAHCRALVRGEAKTTHQGIAISDKKVLLDGQKRLEAVRRTGVSWKLGITFGMTEETFDAIDKVQARQLCDTLARQRGLTNTRMRTAIVRVCAHLAAGVPVPIESEDDFDVWTKHFAAGIDFAVEAFVSVKTRQSQIVGALAFAYAANPTAIENFTNDVILGENLGAKNPALVLRNAIPNMAKRVAGGNNDPILAKVTLNAALLALNEEKMVRVSSSSKGLDYFRSIVVTPKVKATMTAWKQFTVVHKGTEPSTPTQLVLKAG